MGQKEYSTFQEFYPFYLTQHANRTNRQLHVIGTSLGIVVLLYILLTLQLSYLPFGLLVGYGFAWVGHFIFERNKPATFKYPLMSLRGDFRMLYDVATGQLPCFG